MAQQCFEFVAVAAELRGVGPGRPSAQVGDDWRC